MIAIASDHGGYGLKEELIKHFESQGIEYKDCGCHSADSSVDYPDYAFIVTDMINTKEADLGILVCGTGIGMSIAANKVKGIRAALVSDCFSAEKTREHNDSNVLCLGGRVIGPELAIKIADTFINTKFSNDQRHIRRIEKFSDR